VCGVGFVISGVARAKEALGLALAVADSSHDLLLRRASLHIASADYYEAVG